MLRIPLPEDDGFALCTVRGGEGHTHGRLYACTAEKRPRDRRNEGLWITVFLRVLDVVEVVDILDFSAPLSTAGATAYRRG